MKGDILIAPTAEVLAPDDPLKRAIDGHQAVLRAGVDLITAAAQAGEALLELKQRTAAGTWRQWIEDNLPFSYATAHLYMRCYKHQSVIRSQGWTRMTEIKDGLGALVAPEHENKGRNGRARPEWMKDLARDMYGEGATYTAIARELNVHMQTVKCWVDPAFQAESRRKVAAINKRRIRAERLLREQERDRAIRQAVKKAGAAVQEAWAMAERMQDVLAQAQRETTDREAREALSKAGVHYRKMRDEIVKALGVT
jgi:transposase